MGNQKRKSSDIEKEFVVMNDGNGEDAIPNHLRIFLSRTSHFGHRNQRNVARSSMDKGKSKMVATPENYLPIHESIKKKLATVQGRTASRKFHEECYYDFKAFAASSLTKFSTELCCRYFWSHSWCLDHSSILA
ncbi:hypothetical protein AAG906_023654 [Vitis piasezkii]